MSIKTDAENSYFLSHPSERALALCLDEGFNISYGKEHGELSKWLADPKSHLRERFGFAKEILTIYSRHAKTDARVLTAIENISRDPEYKYRIDRAVVLLIHEGNADETKSLLRERLDWIIVPITSAELKNTHRGDLFLRARIAEAIGDVDLFAMSSPITDDKYFFGRDDFVQQLITRSVERCESAGLFGLRKTGKTSVLYAIKRKLARSQVMVEYIDCQNPGIHAARWWEVLENIINRCTALLKEEHSRTVRVDKDYTEVTAGNKFLTDVRALLSGGKLDEILLLLDEVEFITPGISGALGRHWDQDFVPFWQTIRSVHHEVQGRLTFIVAGVNPASVTMSHFGQIPNPIFQLAPPLYLTPLDVSRVREMVRTIGRYSGLDISEEVYPYLTEKYGGHPFLVRLACSEMWRSADVRNPEHRHSVAITSFDALDGQIHIRLEQPVKDILLSLVWWYPEDYDLLLILAEGDAEFVAQYTQDTSGSIMKFTHYGLLSSDGKRFAIADLQDFLRRHGKLYKTAISPFTRGDMPPELLPAVPDLATLASLFEKRTEIEILLRRAILLYLGVKNDWDNAKISKAIIKGLHPRHDRPAKPEDLFMGRTPQVVINDLFTSDLKDVISGNWDVFGPLFNTDRNRFAMNMDTLNKARRVDSHTRVVTQVEMDEIMNSYTWLRARLDKIPSQK